jgi:hypothetical protein
VPGLYWLNTEKVFKQQKEVEIDDYIMEDLRAQCTTNFPGSTEKMIMI